MILLEQILRGYSLFGLTFLGWLEIIELLCFFAGTAALSSGLFSYLLAQEFSYNNKPKMVYVFFGFLFGIRNRIDALSKFVGGSWDEIKSNQDAHAPIRGFVWYAIGTSMGVFILFVA